MFSSLFGPKWRHRDPKVRIAALRLLAADDPVLLERALADEDAAVRRDILARVTDFECLQKIMQSDSDKGVCQCADQRFRKLLCGLAEDSPALGIRLRFIQSMPELSLVEHLACHGQEVELRQHALARVQRPGLLAQIALQDEVGSIRLAAVEQVEQESTLERIAKEARKRDKRVARAAKARLAAIVAQQQGPKQRAQIIAKLGQLAAQGGMDLVGAKALEREWAGWGDQADQREQSAYEGALLAFEKASEDYRIAKGWRQELLVICERAEGVRDELMARQQLNVEDESTVNALLVMVQSAWDDVAESAQTAGVFDHIIASRFQKAIERCGQRVADLHAVRGQLSYLRDLLDAVSHLQDTDNGISRRDIDELKDRWKNAQRVDDAKGSLGFARLDEQFRAALDRAESLLIKDGVQKSELKILMPSLFEQLDAFLEQGQLKSAVGKHDHIRRSISALRRFDRRAASAYETQLQTFSRRLHEMQNWRQFGSHRVREELIDKAVQLAAANPPADVVRDAVPALRAQWKALNKSGSQSNDEEWARFDGACSEAFQVVLEEREEKKRQQDVILAERQALCVELEDIGRQWDWPESDWKSVEKVVHSARRLWREMGPLEYAAYKKIDARFRKALSLFEEPLAEEREVSRVFREGLIEDVEALLEEDDLAKAIDQAKAAQRRWVVTVQGSRKQEQAMWQRFRAAMDNVFARREQQREQQGEERKHVLAVKQAIVDDAAALATSKLADVSAAQKSLSQLRQRFAELDSSPEDHTMMEVFKTTEQALLVTKEDAKRIEQVLAIGHFVHKASLCESMEALVETKVFDGSQRDALVEQWQGLDVLENLSFETRIQARFAMAQAAFEHGGGYPAELLSSNLSCKQDLVLRMEVVRDRPSPDAYAEQRMALKVRLLSEAMTQQDNDDEVPQKWGALQSEWLLCGPVPAFELTELNQRYQRCIE